MTRPGVDSNGNYTVNIGLTKYGRRELVTCTATAASACALLIMLAIKISPMFLPAIVLPVAFWLWVLWFFRDPNRSTPSGDGLFISPADGNVADITQIGQDSPLGCPGVKIGIFMNIFSVHVNRSPASALVRQTVHQDGAFLDARDPHASERNESATIYMTYTHDGQDYPLVVRQIAGMVAKRIVTDLATGQQLSAGQRLGMIKFGSRVELLVPTPLAGRVCVELGQKVHAGLTVLVTVDGEADDD